MRELTISELSVVSGAGVAVRPLVQASLQGAKNVAKHPVAQGGAVGGATYVATNLASGSKMTVAGGTGAVVAGMAGTAFGGSMTAAIGAAVAGGAAERAVNGVNTVLKPDASKTKSKDKSGNEYGH